MGYPIYGNPQTTKHPTVDVASRPAARPESVGKLGSAVCSEASNGMRKLDDRRPSAQHTRSYGKITIYHRKINYFYGHVQ